MAIYEPRYGSGKRTTVSVRLTDLDLERLDYLVEKGAVAPVEEQAYYVAKNRGAAVREAIRAAAKAKRFKRRA